MSAVRVVTDSTAGLSPEFAADYDVAVIPITVTLGARSGLEGVDVSSADVLEALRAKVRIGTSQPTPSAFAEVYAALAAGSEDGAGDSPCEIVSIHLSAELSGTVASAEQVGAESDVPVHVVDSRLVSAGLGFAVEAAAHAARAGGSAAEVVGAAMRAAAATSVYFCVDDLEVLRAGGRIGPASAKIGTVFAVKPLLRIRDGVIEVEQLVRTTRKAMDRLAELAAEVASPSRASVVHLGAPDRAAALAEQLRSSLGLESVPVCEASAAVAAHTGEGVVGVAVLRAGG
jgi:DegV family protein with EDD domain